MHRLRWLALLAILLPSTSTAVQTSTLGAYPTGALASPTPWFRYTLNVNESTHGSVTIDNRSNVVQNLTIYPVDAAPNGDGGFGMEPRAAKPQDAGSWIKLEAASLQLAPHRQRDIAFQLTAPPHPSVGPHYAGIVIQPVVPTHSKQGNTNLYIVSRLGVRAYITIPGVARPRLAIVSLTPKPNRREIKLATVLRNDGNALIAPTGTLTVTPWLGKASVQVFNAGRALAPADRLELQTPTPVKLSVFPRRYTAKLQLRYGVEPHYRTVSRTVTFWIGNVWRWLAGLAVVLLMAAGFAMKYRAHRHRNRHRCNQGQA